MDADEGARHGRVAGEEERLAFLEETREAVTDGVGTEIGSVVAHAHDDHRWLVCT